MRMIDLLVKELPALGGWPENAESVVQDGYGELYYHSFSSPDELVCAKIKLQLADDYQYVGISHDEYRRALATLLPEADQNCEIRYKRGGHWVAFDVVHVDNTGVFGYLKNTPFAGHPSDYEIRYIDKDFHETIGEITRLITGGTPSENAKRVYDAGYRKQK